MRLLSIECEYFRQHVESRISFDVGLTGIVGANGSGKSTLVEAVVFALFGAKAVRGKTDGIVTRGTKRKRPRVRLRFEHGGHGFVVERSLTQASLFIGGTNEPMVTGGRPVTEKIQEILCLNYDEFIATYFTEQKGLEFLSGKRGATERSRFIIKMMGYDKLERAQELLRKDRSDLRNQISGIESTLQDEERLITRVQKEKEQLASTRAELAAADKKVKDAEKSFAEYEGLFKRLEIQKVLFDSQQAQLGKLTAQLDAAAKVLLEQRRQLPELERELAVLEKKVVKWNGAREVFEESLAAIRTKKSGIRERLEQAATNWEEVRVRAAAAVGVLEAQLVRERKSAKELEVLRGAAACPTCGQELGEVFDATLSNTITRCSHAEKELALQQEQLRSVKGEPGEVKELRVQEAEAQKKETMLLEVKPVFDQMERVAKDLARVGAGIAKRQLEHDELTAERAAVEKEAQQIHFSDIEYSRAKAAYETGRQLLEVNRMNRLRHQSAVEKQEALLLRSREELQRSKDARLLLEERKRELLLLDETDTTFTNIRRSLNASIRPRLADLASEFLTDLTDGRYSSVEIGEDFSPTVFEDGEPKPVISGGEQDILNLCVRLALSQLVAERAGHSISLLMLDEVFGSLDENRRYNVLMLLEKLQNRFEQVLLITHLDDIKEGVHHFINVEYDEGTGVVRIDALDSYDMLAMNI